MGYATDMMDLAQTRVRDAWQQSATITVGSTSASVAGIFRRREQLDDLAGGGVPVRTVVEEFDVRTAALTEAGVDPRIGDVLVTDGVTYRITDREERTPRNVVYTLGRRS